MSSNNKNEFKINNNQQSEQSENKQIDKEESIFDNQQNQQQTRRMPKYTINKAFPESLQSKYKNMQNILFQNFHNNQKQEEEELSTPISKHNITKFEISNDNNNATNKQEIEINNNQHSEQSEDEQIDEEESIFDNQQPFRTIPINSIKFQPYQQPHKILSPNSLNKQKQQKQEEQSSTSESKPDIKNAFKFYSDLQNNQSKPSFNFIYKQKQGEEQPSTPMWKPNITKFEISTDNNNATNKQEIEINNNQQSEQSENEQIDEEESIFDNQQNQQPSKTIPINSIKFQPPQQPQQILSPNSLNKQKQQKQEEQSSTSESKPDIKNAFKLYSDLQNNQSKPSFNFIYKPKQEEQSSTPISKPNITKFGISTDNNNETNKQEIEINNDQQSEYSEQSEQSENEQIDKEEMIKIIPKNINNNIKFLPSQQLKQILSPNSPNKQKQQKQEERSSTSESKPDIKNAFKLFSDLENNKFKSSFKFINKQQIEVSYSSFEQSSSSSNQKILKPILFLPNDQNSISSNSNLEKSKSSSSYTQNQQILSSSSNIHKAKSTSSIPFTASKSINEKETPKDYKKEFFEFQKMSEDALLRTINAICTNINLHFNNLNQTVMNDAIPKFVMFILDLQEIQNVKLTNQNNNKLTSEELKNIDSVLNYLINIEPRFDTLMLNFKKEEFIKSSAFLFYSNFLNFYFIRESKQKLLNNCVPFLYCKLNMREFDELEMLTNIDTYLLLANFINHPNSKFNKEEILSKQNEDQLFKDAKIPKLFDQQFLNYCKLLKQIPDFLYYQLQFIFNVIDVNSEKLKIILNLLNIAPKLNFINVPPIDTIAEKINQRIMSKKTMDKKFKLEFSNNNYAMKERQNYGSSSISKPKNHEFKMKLNNNENENRDLNIESSEKFWILNDLFNYSYDNGILFNQELNNQRSKQLENQWINQINDIQQQIKLNNKQQKMLENNQSVLKEAKLYKLFVYDDKKEKWNFDNDSFLNFCNEKSINSNAIKTPLILFLNSFEEDLINITTKLINIQQPNLDENNQQQIFVYALCDIDFLAEIKPIFLLLHVPKTRQNQPKIKNIIFQINSFLSYICDAQVVVLNKKYFMDQIEVIQSFNNLYSQKSEIQHLPKQKPNIYVESKKIDSELNNNNDDDDENVVVIIDDDDDEFEQQANSNSLEQEDHFVSNLNIVKSSSIQMSPKILTRKCKSIFLINDETVHCYDDQFDLEINQSPFFQRIFQSFGKNNLSFHYINVNNQNTYIPFLTSLKKYCSESQLQFNDILKSFQFFKMSELNNRYIQIKSQKTWRNELGKMIMNRFSMLRSNSSDSFHIASMIGEEIKLISIPFDSDFNHECNTILSKIEIKDDKKRQNVFQTFLSNANSFLENMMSFEQYEFLDKKNVSLSKKKVINFLKSEYFRAIKDVYGLNNLTIFYEKNIDILNNSIEECLIEIDKFVQSILIKYDQYRKREDLLYITCGSTNYEIRQREKVKEIKVQIASTGDLKDEIDQDF